MLNELSIPHISVCQHPILDSTLPFAEYIKRYRQLIEERRHLLSGYRESLPPLPTGSRGIPIQTINPQRIIDANSPCEFYPDQPDLTGKRLKYGVLLIHGLLDSPFTFRDLGQHLQ